MTPEDSVVRASVISIGDEVVCGTVPDTNASWLARRLEEMGALVKEHRAVRDIQGDIVNAFASVSESSDIVVVTGGLGPTADDLTREAMSELTGRELIIDNLAKESLLAFFQRRGRPIHPANMKQATMPEGSDALPNERGTAAGFAIRHRRTEFFFMPGVPAEMMHMFDNQVAPRLKGKLSGCRRACRSLIVMGMPESEVGARLADLMERGRNPEVGTMAQTGMIRLRIAGRAVGDVDIKAIVETTAEEVRRRLGRAVAGDDERDLQNIVAGLLEKTGRTVAIAESCTGGMISSSLVDVPGMSRFLLEGIVAYGNAAKIRLLGVPEELIKEHGAVSEEVAKAMAAGLRRRSGADVTLAVTGIAGPGGGTELKPVGLVFIAISDSEGELCSRELFFGEREQVRERAAKTALNTLRLRLLGVI